ncbi:hypothetical protein [Paraburkholderia sp.]|uniref:hypothetical protein n=1 Tax=Paraburkholderia sp. TaxID=1926495 RepID=UPI0025D41DA9|nr:hypothetical protein [Paraburkholderia sp.]
MSQTIAVLFARPDSIYKTLPNCDVWDIDRDARNWPGGSPVVAHPPCRAWGRLAHMAKPRPDEKDLARFAVAMIRKYGGVLEHPSASRLWVDQQLGTVAQPDAWGGWTLPIHQHWFGHNAEKSTLLYIVGCPPAEVPEMPMTLGEAPMVVSTSGRRADGSRSHRRPEIKKDEREHTPIELAKWLVELALRCRVTEAMTA